MSDYTILRQTSFPQINLQQKATKKTNPTRGRQALMAYPFKNLAIGDSVVFTKARWGNSFPTIKRAASRYGEQLGRYFQTHTLQSGDLAVRRVY